jgi:hypothetical protein
MPQASARPLRQHSLRRDTDQLIARATRDCIRRIGTTDYPAFKGSRVERLAGRDYVLLQTAAGLLAAVYRVGSFDSLRWVEKDEYPEELASQAGY